MTPLELTQKKIYLGTSSWKYDGWRGWLYQQPYRSEKAFNEKCLEEYATLYPTVGVDHTYYAWPLPSTFAKYVGQTPASFRFGLKVTEEVTVLKYPNLSRYGKRAGTDNPHFLDADLFVEKFLGPLEEVKHRLGPLMFEFSHFYPGMIPSGREFVERLGTFLSKLPKNEGLLYAVELRNQTWLQAPYFETLAKHQVAHVVNSWTKMPSIGEQFQALQPYDLPAYVARLLLQPGTKYAEAVEAFSPYTVIQEESSELRSQAAHLIQTAVDRKIPSFVFVNNRFEGCAPKTIEGILSLVS